MSEFPEAFVRIRPATPLAEERLREIVREELAAALDELAKTISTIVYNEVRDMDPYDE